MTPYPEYFARGVGKARFDRSIISAWERGDFSPAKWTHPGLDFVIADGPQPGSWKGAVPEGFRTWVNAWEQFRVEADEYRELDDERVFILTRMDAAFEFYDPEIVWQVHYGPVELRDPYQGHEGVREWFKEWLAPFETYSGHAETFIDAGESVVVGVRQGGRGKTSGALVETPAWIVYTLRNGRAVHVEIFETKSEAFGAAGIPE